MLNQILSTMLAGIGLLLISLKILEACMHDLTSGNIRLVIKKHTSNNYLAAFWGSLLGLVAGDAAVVCLIAGTLYTCKSIGLNRAMVMSTWSNFGACCLFFIVFFNIDILVLYLLGITGFSFYLEKPFKWRNIIGTIFAVSLMLYSISLMRSQTEAIVEIPWVVENLHTLQSSYLKPFLIATFLLVIIQADIVVIVMIANLLQSNVITLEQSMFMVFGMHFGLAATNFIVGINLKGVLRQIMLAQVLVAFTLAILFSALVIIEILTGIPLLMALTLAVSNSPWTQLIFVVLVTNFLVSLVYTYYIDTVAGFLQKWFPISESADPATPKFITKATVSDPESALDLISQELFDLLKRLPKNIEFRIATPNHDKAEPILKLRHEQFEAVIEEARTLMKEINSQHVASETKDKMLMLSDRLQIVKSLEEGTYHLTSIELPDHHSKGVQTLAMQIYEAQQALMETILDAIETRSEEDISILIKATANIKPVIEKIRHSYLKQESASSMQAKMVILNMTSLLERNVWLLGRLTSQFIPKLLAFENPVTV